MKYTIKNPLNSPYNVPSENGQVHIPARGTATGDFTEIQIQQIRAVGYFSVEGGDAFEDDPEYSRNEVKMNVTGEAAEPRARRGRPRKDA